MSYRQRNTRRYNLRDVKRINYKNILKRKRSGQCYIVNKKRKLNDNSSIMINDDPDIWKPLRYKTEEAYLSPTRLKNYVLNDTILDFLKLKSKRNNDKTIIPKELKSLFKRGNKFEEKVCQNIRKQFPGETKTICKSYKDLTEENFKRTVKYMKKGIKFIFQAPLIDTENRTRGIADILARADCIDDLIHKKIIYDVEKTSIGYYYVVIDIKWTTIHLCSNGLNIRNYNLMKSYKVQLAIYTYIIGKIQGITPDESYLLGKAYRYIRYKKKYEHYNCFARLGVVNFDGKDKIYINYARKALDWYRLLLREYENWSCDPPSNKYLYPNMNNKYDKPYTQKKKELALKYDEITNIGYISLRDRNIAHKNGIYKSSDPRCTTELMDIIGTRALKIKRLLQVHQNNILIEPNLIRNNYMGWQDQKDIEIYVDFEAISGTQLAKEIDLENSETPQGIIFMIGIGYEESGNWQFKNFSANMDSLKEEKIIVQKFVNYINTIIDNHMEKYNIKEKSLCNPIIFHWGNAEPSMLRNASRRHNRLWNSWMKKIDWINLCKIFKNEPIVVNSQLGFGLKSVATAMYKNSMIKTIWTNEVSGGFSAMLTAVKCYNSMNNSEIENSVFMNQVRNFSLIEKYNEIDCKTMWEIVKYLRENHCYIEDIEE